MSLIYIFAASRMEGRPAERLITARSDGGNTDVAEARLVQASRFELIITGMGPRWAEAGARSAFGLGEADALKSGSACKRPVAAMVIGLCGALSASLQEGDLVTYTEVVSTETRQPPLPCARNLQERITNGLASKGVPCSPIVGITSSRIATTQNEKIALARRGASAVDMESYAVLSAAAAAGVPAVVLRAVSDSLHTRMPDFNPALGAGGRIESGKAARIAARHPLQTARLLLGSQRSMRKLSGALELLFRSDVLEGVSAGASETPGATP